MVVTLNVAGTYGIRVNNPDGQSSAYVTFKVNPIIPAPSISTISPASLTASTSNQTLTINGVNFISGATLSCRHAVTTSFASPGGSSSSATRQ